MRELVFALEYEPGCNRVADTLAKYPDTRIRSVSLHATADHCGATQRTQVLESTGDMLVLYSYWERMSSCASVPHMALEHLGRGALFEATKTERCTTWRIVHSAPNSLSSSHILGASRCDGRFASQN